MTLHNSYAKLSWCAVCLLLSGCQTTYRWLDERFEVRNSTPREALVSQDRRTEERRSLSSPDAQESDVDQADAEISLVGHEESDLNQEVAVQLPLDHVQADQALLAGEAGASLTLEALERMALENNPAIQQAMASVSKAAGFREQVGLLPNPTLAYDGQQLFDARTDQHMLTLSQGIVTAHKLGLNRQVLNHSVQAQLWLVEVQRLRVLTDVRTTYYETLGAQRQLALATEFQVLAAKGVSIAQTRKVALEGSQPEILQAEIQLNEVELQQQQSGIQVRAAWKDLAANVGLPDLSLVKLEGELPKTAEPRDWDAVYEELASRSPELRAAQSLIDRASANLCRQDVQAIPNLQMQLSAGKDYGTNSQIIMASVGGALPVFNQNQGNISAAHAEYCRATQEYQRLRLSLKSRLARSAQGYDSARAAVQRYEGQILPRAKQSLTLSEQAYAAGEFNFLQVLTARRIYFDSNLRAVDARRQLAQAATLIDGLLLTGGLSDAVDTGDDDSLRGQALSGQ